MAKAHIMEILYAYGKMKKKKAYLNIASISMVFFILFFKHSPCVSTCPWVCMVVRGHLAEVSSLLLYELQELNLGYLACSFTG